MKNGCTFFCSFLVCFRFVDILLKCSSLESGLIQKESCFLGFSPPSFFSLGKTHTVRSFYFCSIKGNEAQKVSCNKGLRKNSLKSGYRLQRYLKKGSSSVWHLVLFGKTKKGKQVAVLLSSHRKLQVFVAWSIVQEYKKRSKLVVSVAKTQFLRPDPGLSPLSLQYETDEDDKQCLQ